MMRGSVLNITERNVERLIFQIDRAVSYTKGVYDLRSSTGMPMDANVELYVLRECAF